MTETTQSQTVEARIVVETTQDVPTFYVNHAEIGAGPHEYAIWMARLPVKPSRDEMLLIQESGEFVVEPEVQILIPHSMVPGLIAALAQTLAAHEAKMSEGSLDV